MLKYFRYHIPWLLWLTLIVALCLTPGDKLPTIEWELISIGTCTHFFLYFLLILLMLMGFLTEKQTSFEKKLNRSNLKVYLVLVLVGISIGYSIELIQGSFIFQRYYSPEDIIVNGIGTIFGALTYTLIGRKLV